MKEGVGDEFQKETKYRRGNLSGGGLDWDAKPETYKRYPGAELVDLPQPACDKPGMVWDALRMRRSVREFADGPISPAQLSQLLWAAQGITARLQGYGLRTAPSAGALYPLELYVAVHNVSAIDQGMYHYAVETRQLERLEKGDFRLKVARAALDQEMAYSANAVFVWTAVFERSMWKYKQRAYRYIYLDAGHSAQNLALAAVALGLGSCQIGALYDDEANGMLGVDGISESTIYMTAVGKM